MVWLMQRRDVIAFQARVTAYEKGYKGYRKDVYKPIEIDYRLSNPTKLPRSLVQAAAPLCLLVLLYAVVRRRVRKPRLLFGWYVG